MVNQDKLQCTYSSVWVEVFACKQSLQKCAPSCQTVTVIMYTCTLLHFCGLTFVFRLCVCVCVSGFELWRTWKGGGAGREENLSMKQIIIRRDVDKFH